MTKKGEKVSGTLLMQPRDEPGVEQLPTQRERVGTEAASFRDWFRGSRVVDRSGMPLVVYHGTDSKESSDLVSTNWRHDLGAHFGSAEQANARIGCSPKALAAMERDGELSPDIPMGHREGRRLIPVFLSLKNPVRLPDMNDWNHPREWLRRVHECPARLREAILQIAYWDLARWHNGDSFQIAEDMKQYLDDVGYDGVIYTNRHEARRARGSHRSFIAFYLEQIRSVFAAE
jgi:hypothetical protein